MPGVDIPGMEGADGEAVNYGATGEIPGVPDPSDNDSDNDEHNPIRTRSGRTVHSTQNPDYVCILPLDLTPLFYNKLENLRLTILGRESSH